MMRLLQLQLIAQPGLGLLQFREQRLAFLVRALPKCCLLEMLVKGM